MNYMTEAMLYAAARAQHVSEVIRPALEAGKVVICDRYVDSSIAYQGYGRKLGEAVAVINGYAVQGCMPDLTFLFKLFDPAVGKKRIRTELQDRLDAEAEAFHADVYRGYLHLEQQFADRFCGIDASRSIAEIKADVCLKLTQVLKAWEAQEAPEFREKSRSCTHRVIRKAGIRLSLTRWKENRRLVERVRQSIDEGRISHAYLIRRRYLRG